MDMFKHFLPAPKVHPMLNIGCLQDIPTGKYLLGKHGESILLGGMAYVEGVCGRGNQGKSTLMLFRILRALTRFRRALWNMYDTETSLRFLRLNSLYKAITGVVCDLEDTGKVIITDNTVMSGNKWFTALQNFSEDKQKAARDWYMTTPFIDPKTGKNCEAFYPTFFGVDSLSQFMTDAVEKIFDKNEVGEGGANTVFMKGGQAKKQVLMQMPTTTGQAGLYVTMSIHMGDQIVMDQYNPPAKLLADMKNNSAMKDVPKNITFLTNNLWNVFNSGPLLHKEAKTPLYPMNSDDDMEGDLDLRIMTVQNIRAKNGPTGMPFELVWSQREGILAGLSEYNYLKHFDRYGIGGNDRNFYLELVPDISLSRTTIRGKIAGSEKLQRALEITSEMCQMQNLWLDDEGLFCTPLELYNDLKAQGYDWDVLLDTRGFWVFEIDAPDYKPFLSTMDLLRMRKKLYHPYWLPPLGTAASEEPVAAKKMAKAA